MCHLVEVILLGWREFWSSRSSPNLWLLTLQMIPAIQSFIVDTMGQKYIEPPTFDLSLSYRDSSYFTPLVFVLSPGADPMAVLFRFAEEQGNDTGGRLANSWELQAQIENKGLKAELLKHVPLFSFGRFFWPQLYVPDVRKRQTNRSILFHLSVVWAENALL